MAGSAKPSIQDLGPEGSIVFGGTYTTEFAGPSILVNGVLNDKLLINVGEYFTFTITDTCNIYAYLGATYADGGGSFGANVLLYKVVNSTDVLVGSFATTNGGSPSWYKLFSDLESGTYKVTSSIKYVGFSEWYVETRAKILLKQDGQYYSLLDTNYNTTSKTYTPLASGFDFKATAFEPSVLVTNKTLGGETFKPIDKFNNFQLVSNNAMQNFSLKGIKTTRELIAPNSDITLSIAANIDYVKITSISSGTATVKLAVSFDKGVTWKTHNGTSFVDLQCVIPQKFYGGMTDSEKQQWDSARDLIYTEGIPVSNFNLIDFNQVDAEYLRVAYVLDRPTYLEDAQTTQLDWKFDARGIMKKMTDTEAVVDVTYNKINVTTTVATNILKVNIIS